MMINAEEDMWMCQCGMGWGRFDYECSRCGQTKDGNSLKDITEEFK